jgi:hypothetical protein
MSAELLAELRDLHLPPAPGFWPPAPGLWLLVALVAATLLGLAAWRRRRSPLRGWLRRELRRIRNSPALRADRAALVGALAPLMRRMALARHGVAAAGLAGEAWARHLAAHAPPGCDPRAWHAIAVSRYAPGPPDVEPRILLASCERWLLHASR